MSLHRCMQNLQKQLECKGETVYFEHEILSKATLSSIFAPKESKAASKHAFQENVIEEEHGEDDSVDKCPTKKLLEFIFEQDTKSSES